MKKTYQAPKMDVIIIQQSQSLLAGSINAQSLTGLDGWGGTYDYNDEAD